MLKINEYYYRLCGKDNFVHKNHTHNEIELIQVTSGNGIVLKNDRTYMLKSQHLYVIDARNAHIVYPQPEDCDNYVRNKIVIEADSFVNFFKGIGLESILDELLASAPVSTAEAPEIDALYEKVHDLCATETPENVGFAHAYVLELVHWIYRQSKTRSHEEKNDTLQKMLNLIARQEGVISLDEISTQLHMNKYYLCHLFKEKTGRTLTDYLAGKVYEKSCRLLSGTSYSIEEIARLCGFASSASFSRFFKQKSDLSPTVFRKTKGQGVKLIF